MPEGSFPNMYTFSASLLALNAKQHFSTMLGNNFKQKYEKHGSKQTVQRILI
jgi:hypothetical protein